MFITLDDYYLIKKVSDKGILELVTMMERERIDYIRLFSRPKRATGKELYNYKGVFQIDTSVDYSVNLYSGIWTKKFLESTVRVPKNAWKFEVILHKRAMEYGAKCVVSNRADFQILDVVRKGKLLHKSAAYFKRHPDIYDGEREVNSWSYEIRLGIQTMASRHLPGMLKTKVKAFMTKRGRRFYSDEVE